MRIDYEAEYNNRARVPESVEIQLRWTSASMAARQQMQSELDLPYGPRPRQKYDLFLAQQRSKHAPVAVYIHGGYWQRGDRKDYSFVARELVARGIDVAIPSYTLCPEASIGDIIEELRSFLGLLWQRAKCRPVVIGHSAGGHLAAALMAMDWSKLPDTPADLVRAAYSISGVFDLEPLIGTSLNDALRLSGPIARDASPLRWPPPPRDRKFVAAVGGAESQEFLRQSLDMTQRWSHAGVKAECIVVPGANHFTVVDELARRESAMIARIADFAHTSSVG